MAAPGPTLPTWALQQVVGYRGYSGRDANVVAEAALDPKPPLRDLLLDHIIGLRKQGLSIK